MHESVPAEHRSFTIADPVHMEYAGRSGAGRWAIAFKRSFDTLASALGLLFLSPVLLLIGAVIRLDSSGPVLLRQRRVGKAGRAFYMYKFRTMAADSDEKAHQRYVTQMIREDDGSLRNGHGAFKLEHDPRITRVGRFLRTYSLDEFPQLINVLKGDMSLVGPRPPLPYEVALYNERHLRRLEAVPGMTGLWQVSGRNETTFEEMVDLDLSYIENWSPLLDIRILLRTVAVLIKERAA